MVIIINIYQDLNNQFIVSLFVFDIIFYFIIHSFICLNEDFILVFKLGTSRLANLGTFCTLQRLALDPPAKSHTTNISNISKPKSSAKTHTTNILKQNSLGKKDISKIGTMVCQKFLVVCSIYAYIL